MLAEQQNLPLLLDHLRQQTWPHFTVYLCVNNVEGGFGYEENQACLKKLEKVCDIPLVVIDRSSPGLGWTGKKKGVGWARKVIFEKIITDHNDDELIVSLDADTDFDADYLEAVVGTMNACPNANAFSIPYYHPLNGQEQLDRPMLRYECYMRHYLINLLRISSPYAFTALGSAIAFPAWAYKRVGGITPLQGGEDFYLLQKFAKTGAIVNNFISPYREQKKVVRPQGRISPRVPFGTGPAIAKGISGMDESYPFYSQEGFKAIKDTFDSFAQLYTEDIETPMSDFLRQQLGTNDLWESLRQNFKTQDRFVHSCSERVDGLRILQFLKNTPNYRLDPTSLPIDFGSGSISMIDDYRNQLFDLEMSLR